MTRLPRRAVLGGGLALPFIARPAWAASARVVIIGGGFGGAMLARVLRTLDPSVSVTLVESSASYTACPLSNQVITGLRPLASQRFSFDGLIRAGIAVKIDTAIAIDPHARRVSLQSGAVLDYDRLVLAPGIDFRWNALPGSSPEAAEIMPHAWKGEAQMVLLSRQLQAIPDGGVVVMTVPEAPYRCPPAPYERASLIAHFLKTQRKRCKLLVLDAKEQFSNQKTFQAQWQRLYPDLLEWVPPSQGGNPASIDARAMKVSTDFDDHIADVANIIPPQRAGRIAELAGVADRSLWCPVDPMSFESRLQPGIHVIGDAIIGGALPKAASATKDEAWACAQSILLAFGGPAPVAPRVASACYMRISADEGFSTQSAYHPADGDNAGMFAESPEAAHTSAVSAVQVREGEAWFGTLTKAAYG